MKPNLIISIHISVPANVLIGVTISPSAFAFLYVLAQLLI
jgi:hypothetical protein